jgi:hypothetical protein
MDKIIDAFKFMYIDLPMRVYNTLKSVVGYVADKVVSVFSGMVTAVIGAIKAGINQGINLVNKIIPVDGWKLPLLGDGGVVKQAGAGIVGEKGAEMVNLPSGASVSPNKSLEDFKIMTIESRKQTILLATIADNTGKMAGALNNLSISSGA